jgi:hypothetical protein
MIPSCSRRRTRRKQGQGEADAATEVDVAQSRVEAQFVDYCWQAFLGSCAVGAAFIPLGLAFGVLVVHSGLSGGRQRSPA